MPSVAQARLALASLVLGAFTFIGGVRVERTSLDGFTLERGANVTMDEAPEEIAYLSIEREAIANPPSLVRAAEIAERTLYRRGIRGRFQIRNRIARWHSDAGSSTRIDREALQELVEWSAYLGVEAAVVGNFAAVQDQAAQTRAA